MLVYSHTWKQSHPDKSLRSSWLMLVNLRLSLVFALAPCAMALGVKASFGSDTVPVAGMFQVH